MSTRQIDLLGLYKKMLFCRLYEEEVIKIWDEGKISGEMHPGIGEEAIIAGVVSHLKDGDAMALDHRGTSAMLLRGVDPVSLLKEFLGSPEGLCNGWGGHMHLFSSEKIIASSGIVGASGPAAAGFALAGLRLRPGSVSAAMFGEGAMNQGMLMESMNLASAWKLPVIFICKDNKMAITTLSSTVTGGKLIDRAKGFGIDGAEIDGTDVETVWETAGNAIDNCRFRRQPFFIQAHCVRPQGHFFGDPLVKVNREPVKQMMEMAGPLIKSVASKKGASVKDRTKSLKTITSLIGKSTREQFRKGKDPLNKLRKILKPKGDKLKKIESEVKSEIKDIVKRALGGQGK